MCLNSSSIWRGAALIPAFSRSCWINVCDVFLCALYGFYGFLSVCCLIVFSQCWRLSSLQGVSIVISFMLRSRYAFTLSFVDCVESVWVAKVLSVGCDRCEGGSGWL